MLSWITVNFRDRWIMFCFSLMSSGRACSYHLVPGMAPPSPWMEDCVCLIYSFGLGGNIHFFYIKMIPCSYEYSSRIQLGIVLACTHSQSIDHLALFAYSYQIFASVALCCIVALHMWRPNFKWLGIFSTVCLFADVITLHCSILHHVMFLWDVCSYLLPIMSGDTSS